MRELKEHIFSDIDEVFPRGYCGPLPSHENRPYYLKSEVDKQIEELKENHKKEVGQLLMKITELEKLVGIANKLIKKSGFKIKDVTFGGAKLEGIKTQRSKHD